MYNKASVDVQNSGLTSDAVSFHLSYCQFELLILLDRVKANLLSVFIHCNTWIHSILLCDWGDTSRETGVCAQEMPMPETAGSVWRYKCQSTKSSTCGFVYGFSMKVFQVLAQRNRHVLLINTQYLSLDGEVWPHDRKLRFGAVQWLTVRGVLAEG